MTKSSQSMLSLINDILDFSKMEAGKMKIESNWFQLDTLIEDVIDFFAEASNKKGIDLLYNVIPPGMKIKSDQGRIRQVLVNLLSNAIKFTEKGQVSLQVLKTAIDELKFIVTDTGIGIPNDAANTLFVPFSQIDNPASKKTQGTGLGLVRVVEL
jgi:two-component system sensor histidine kinase/response regulator